MTATPRQRIVQLSTVHDRDDVRIFHKQCRSLAAAGHDVTLLVADGLGAAQRDGVTIVDLGRRPAGRLARMMLLPWRALRAVRALRPALLHFHDPELLPLGWLMTLLPAPGWPVARLAPRVAVVYDAHEDVPQQILAKHWLPRRLRPALARVFATFEGAAARRLRGVVVANPPNLPRFVALGCDAVCVNNFPLLREFPEPSAAPRRARTLVYVGGLTRARGVVQLVQALALMPGATLLLCGRFADDGCEAACRALPGWAQVEYLGHVGRAGIQQALASAEVGMVTLLPEPNYRVALPVKLFEYMAAALPVVASDIALWRAIIEAERCGVVVDPTDPNAIARATLALLADPQRAAMGARGRAAVLRQYHWDAEARKLLALVDRACAPLR